MTTIDPKAMTLVNIFTVEPAKQDELGKLLVVATREVMCALPGFISATIHKSRDGKHVINYAQWRSIDEFEAMQRDPRAKEHMGKAAQLATFQPIVCEIVESIT